MTNKNSAQEFIRLAQETDDNEEKLELYDKALEITPDDVDILIKIAEDLTWDYGFDDEGYDKETLKRVNKAINLYDEALKKKPDDVNILMKKAEVLTNEFEFMEEISGERALKRCNEAIYVFSEVLKIEPENVDVLREKAELLGEIDQTEEAIKVYNEAIKIEPENVDVLREKAELLGEVDQTEEAIKVYNEAIKIEPEDVYILKGKANLLNEVGLTEEAMEVYDKALKIEPENVEILNEKAELLVSLNMKDEALSILYNKGIECFNIGDFKCAFSCFRSLTDIDEKRVDIWIKKGDAKFELGNYKQSRDQYKSALKREPNNAEAWHKKGKAHEKIGESEEAIKCYNKALQIDPTYDSSKNFDENTSTYTSTNTMDTNHESGSEDFDITSLYFEPKQKRIIISQITTALKNGKHIILSGPPGTGKSKLAKEICHFHKNDYHMCTATSDWSTFETIGGYRPDEDNKLKFFPGIFLQCFKDNNNKPSNHWLIIDEINRADIDKAFGSLFSALTGDDVVLPFKMSDEFVKIVGKFDKDTTYGANHFIIPDDWHIIATMNTFDKSSLYEMSYAFMRRFAFIPIDVPQEINKEMVREYVKYWGVDKISDQICSNLSDLWNLINKSRKVGPAIIEDLYKYIEKTCDYTSALILFVLPQFEGLMEEEQISFVKKTLKEFDFVNDHDRLKGFVSDFFGIDPREFSSNESDE